MSVAHAVQLLVVTDDSRLDQLLPVGNVFLYLLVSLLLPLFLLARNFLVRSLTLVRALKHFARRVLAWSE